MRLPWLALLPTLLSACFGAADCSGGAPFPGAAIDVDEPGDVAEIAGEPEGERVLRPRGWCASPRSANPNERVQTSYSGALRDRGSAPSLRGRVALVTLLVSTPRHPWTRARRSRLAKSATLARDFLLRESRRYDVPDLTIDVITLDASANPVLLPPLATDGYRRLDADVMAVLDDAVRGAAQQSLGKSLEELTDGYRAQGYRSVAFVAAFPFDSRARDYAFSQSDGWGDRPELAFVFAPSAVGELSYTLAHESLHLFGAEDLYALASYDSADRRDVMQVYCANAGASLVAGTTACAIGWRDRPPARSYPIAP